MLAYLIGMIIGEHQENKRQKENFDYKKVDIENLERVLANARLVQNGEDKYLMKGDTYKNKEKAKSINQEVKDILNRLIANFDIQKHEVDLLVTEMVNK